MLGRLLFPVGRFDNWEACLMLIGVGGSGKTTVTDAVINAGNRGRKYAEHRRQAFKTAHAGF